MILYGRNPVREALRSSRRGVQRVWATEAAQRSEDWLAEAAELHTADAAWIEERAGSADHQGICAEADGYPYADPGRLLADEQALVVALDEVQDPHNLGAVCRVAESAGAAGVVIPERRAAEVTAGRGQGVRGRGRAPAGGARAQPGRLARGGQGDGRLGLRRRGRPGGRRRTTEPDYRGRVVLVLGSEGKGLRPRVAAACDQLVALPQLGRVGSLNVSTAAAALMYGILQFRK